MPSPGRFQPKQRPSAETTIQTTTRRALAPVCILHLLAFSVRPTFPPQYGILLPSSLGRAFRSFNHAKTACVAPIPFMKKMLINTVCSTLFESLPLIPLLVDACLTSARRRSLRQNLRTGSRSPAIRNRLLPQRTSNTPKLLRPCPLCQMLHPTTL